MKSLNKFKKGYQSFTEICKICNGSGKKLKVRKRCCDSLGQRIIRCKACIKGKYKTKNSMFVTCKLCKGTSILKKVRCKICVGKRDNNNNFVSVTCYNCKGSGRSKISSFNPVIPKGISITIS